MAFASSFVILFAEHSPHAHGLANNALPLSAFISSNAERIRGHVCGFECKLAPCRGVFVRARAREAYGLSCSGRIGFSAFYEKQDAHQLENEAYKRVKCGNSGSHLQASPCGAESDELQFPAESKTVKNTRRRRTETKEYLKAEPQKNLAYGNCGGSWSVQKKAKNESNETEEANGVLTIDDVQVGTATVAGIANSPGRFSPKGKVPSKREELPLAINDVRNVNNTEENSDLGNLNNWDSNGRASSFIYEVEPKEAAKKTASSGAEQSEATVATNEQELATSCNGDGGKGESKLLTKRRRREVVKIATCLNEWKGLAEGDSEVRDKAFESTLGDQSCDTSDGGNCENHRHCIKEKGETNAEPSVKIDSHLLSEERYTEADGAEFALSINQEAIDAICKEEEVPKKAARSRRRQQDKARRKANLKLKSLDGKVPSAVLLSLGKNSDEAREDAAENGLKGLGEGKAQGMCKKAESPRTDHSCDCSDGGENEMVRQAAEFEEYLKNTGDSLVSEQLDANGEGIKDADNEIGFIKQAAEDGILDDEAATKKVPRKRRRRRREKEKATEKNHERNQTMESLIGGGIGEAGGSKQNNVLEQRERLKDEIEGTVTEELLLGKEQAYFFSQQANFETERSDLPTRAGRKRFVKGVTCEPEHFPSNVAVAHMESNDNGVAGFKGAGCVGNIKQVLPIDNSGDCSVANAVNIKDHSVLASVKQGCMVTWIVEADLKPSQQLFVVGACPCLGAWEPLSAIPLFPDKDVGQLTLWKGQAQVPFETRAEYNYFVKISNDESTTIIWRPGHKLHLSIPPHEKLASATLRVKDELNFTVENKLPALLWGAWWKELGFPPQLRKLIGIESPSFEQTLTESSVEGNGDESGKVVAWKEASLNQSLHCEESVEKGEMPLCERNEHFDGGEKIREENTEDVLDTFPKFDAQSKIPPILKRKSGVPAEILVNSSGCTVQRVAILEEGKLVELLLEPVNTEIKVGNIYLGVVKKLLPGMTGVFVDIGATRIAFLSIKKNSYPYTFPSLTSSSADSNGSVRSNSLVTGIIEDDGDAMGKTDNILEEELLVDADNDSEGSDDDDGDDEEVLDEEEDVEGSQFEDLTYSEISVAASCTADADVDGMKGGMNRSNSNGFVEKTVYVEELEIAAKQKAGQLIHLGASTAKPKTANFGHRFAKWRKLEEGMKIIVQVRREPLARKGPKVSAFPYLESRFWILISQAKLVGVSKKIIGSERKRLKQIAESLKPTGFGLTVRTEAAGQSSEELEKDLMQLIETWKCIEQHAAAAAVAAESGGAGAVPVLLHRAMSQTLSVVQDLFAERVQRMVVDTLQTYEEVADYLQRVAPHLFNRLELYTGRLPIFDAFSLEAEIEKFLNKRVNLPNGAYLVIEETEALVSIDVNGGIGMLGRRKVQSEAILEVNLAAARQIARELRLRDIGGIIVVDYIDMDDPQHESMVYEEMHKAIQHDRSAINITEISELGLMEITRKRVRPSLTFLISDPCSCCHGTGRVEALETSLSKIERSILRLLSSNPDASMGIGTWKKILLRVDPVMFDFLTKKQCAAQLSSALQVHLVLKVGRELGRAQFEVSELRIGAEKRQFFEEQQRVAAQKIVRPLHTSTKE